MRTEGTRRECALLFVALLSVFLITHSGVDTSEASYHYAVAENIVQHGELGFSRPMHGIYTTAPNGRTYASHEIGNTLALLPVALVNTGIQRNLTSYLGARRVDMITRLLFSLMGAILCAAGLVLLYLILRLVFEQPVQPSLRGILVFGFCTFWWSYSRIIFDGLLCAVLLSAAVLFLFVFARIQRTSLLVLAFCCLGFGLITRLTMALGIAAACVYLFLTLRAGQLWRVARVIAVTMAPFVAWQLYYNHLRTGNALISPVQTAQYAINNGLNGNLLIGFPGLLFSPGKSLFLYSPVVLFSILLFVRFARRYRNEAAFVGVLGVLWLLLHAQLHSWFGAWGWGPRLLLTVTPVLSLPFLVERFSVRATFVRALAIAVLGFGFVLATASIVVNWHYRMMLADANGQLDEPWVWSFNKNQVVDALAGAANDLRGAGLGGSESLDSKTSAANLGPHETINLWWVTAHRKGVPAAPLAGAVIMLALVAATCFVRLHRTDRHGQRCGTQLITFVRMRNPA